MPQSCVHGLIARENIHSPLLVQITFFKGKLGRFHLLTGSVTLFHEQPPDGYGLHLVSMALVVFFYVDIWTSKS